MKGCDVLKKRKRSSSVKKHRESYEEKTGRKDPEERGFSQREQDPAIRTHMLIKDLLAWASPKSTKRRKAEKKCFFGGGGGPEKKASAGRPKQRGEGKSVVRRRMALGEKRLRQRPPSLIGKEEKA